MDTLARRLRIEGRAALLLVAATLAASATARAESQTFLFTVTTPSEAKERWAVSYDTAVADRSDGPFGYDGLEQRVRLQGAFGHGFTVIGQAALGLNANKSSSSVQELEVLKDVVSSTGGGRLALGLGIRRKWDGSGVALGRVAVGRNFTRSSLFGNVRFERAFSKNRDGVDLITTLGWLRRVAPALQIGVESVAEDLEGLWEKAEAEGGTRLFVGPSIHVAPPGRRWSASLCGGPLLLQGKSARENRAARVLGPGGGNAYTIRLALGYSF
jgi:hypothetical protein